MLPLWFITSTISVLLTGLRYAQQRPATIMPTGPPEEDCVCDPVRSSPFRVEFGAGPGVTVYGWPSKGGI